MADVSPDLAPRGAWLKHILADPEWATKEWPGKNEKRFAAFLDKQVNGAEYAARSDSGKQERQEPYRLICEAVFAKKQPGLWATALVKLRELQKPCVATEIPAEVITACVNLTNSTGVTVEFTPGVAKQKSKVFNATQPHPQAGRAQAKTVLTVPQDADFSVFQPAFDAALATLGSSGFEPSQPGSIGTEAEAPAILKDIRGSIAKHDENDLILTTFAKKCLKAFDPDDDGVCEPTWAAVTQKVFTIAAMKRIPGYIRKAYDESQNWENPDRGSKFYAAVAKLDSAVVAAAKYNVNIDMFSVDDVLKLTSVYDWFDATEAETYGASLATAANATPVTYGCKWQPTGGAVTEAGVNALLVPFVPLWNSANSAVGNDEAIKQFHESIKDAFDGNLVEGEGGKHFWDVKSKMLPGKTISDTTPLDTKDQIEAAARACALKAAVCWKYTIKDGNQYRPKNGNMYAEWAVTFARAAGDPSTIVRFVQYAHKHLQESNVDAPLFAQRIKLSPDYTGRLLQRRSADSNAKVKLANARSDECDRADAALEAENLNARLRIATTDAINEAGDSADLTQKIFGLLESPDTNKVLLPEEVKAAEQKVAGWIGNCC